LTAKTPTEDTKVYVFATSTQDTSKVSAGYEVTVKAPSAVGSVTISGANAVAVNGSITLLATVTPADAVQDVTWSVSLKDGGGDASGVATIDPNSGVLTGIAVGEVTVTATSVGNNASDSPVTATKEITVIHKTWVFGSTTKDKADYVIDGVIYGTNDITLGDKAETNTSSPLTYETVTYTTRIRFGGAWQSGGNSTRWIAIQVSGSCTIKALMGANTDRYLYLGSSAGDGIVDKTIELDSAGNSATSNWYSLTYSGGAATLYLYPKGNDVSIYGLSIVYDDNE
jgi:hypothetical protein